MNTKFLLILIVAASAASCHRRMGCSIGPAIVTPPFFHRSSDYTSKPGSRSDLEELSFKENGDNYKIEEENPFIASKDNAISSFSTDADGASYTNIRRFLLQESILPPKASIRTEELINHFDMNYRENDARETLSMNGEVSSCPWNPSHQLLRIGIKGKQISKADLPPSNFVFLIDVSGSMTDNDKLPLFKEGIINYVKQMREQDRVAIVTYAGYAATALESTSGADKKTIIKAIEKLGAGGSTAGADGINTAYKIADKYKFEGGNNRIVLGTDGDFNVGITNADSLLSLIENKRKSGIYLTVFGFGRGNLNDAVLEQLADNGNGNYEYIDGIDHLNHLFIDDFNKFYAVANDVKIELKFNPLVVDSFRLIGYENRLMSHQEFLDSTKDAGEIAAGQSITALYEIILKSNTEKSSNHIAVVDFRYRNSIGGEQKFSSLEINNSVLKIEEASDQMKLASGVAWFAMQLADSKYKGKGDYAAIKQTFSGINASWEQKYVRELFTMIDKAASL